jgi:hypothetical protein
MQCSQATAQHIHVPNKARTSSEKQHWECKTAAITAVGVKCADV